MSKPFFYRITAADFLAAVVTVPEADRAAWVLSLALDMVSGDVDNAKSSFAKDIIIEAGEFSDKKRAAANKRWSKSGKQSKTEDMQTDAVHMQCNASSSSSSSSSTEAVTETKQTPKDKRESLIIPDFIKLETWNDFKKMRTAIKKKMTDSAMKRMINKLTKAHNAGHDVETMLEQSILNSWSDVYEPKNGSIKKQSKQPVTTEGKDEWLAGGFKDATM